MFTVVLCNTCHGRRGQGGAVQPEGTPGVGRTGMLQSSGLKACLERDFATLALPSTANSREQALLDEGVGAAWCGSVDVLRRRTRLKPQLICVWGPVGLPGRDANPLHSR